MARVLDDTVYARMRRKIIGANLFYIGHVVLHLPFDMCHIVLRAAQPFHGIVAVALRVLLSDTQFRRLVRADEATRMANTNAHGVHHGDCLLRFGMKIIISFFSKTGYSRRLQSSAMSLTT